MASRRRVWLGIAGATGLALVVRLAYLAELSGTPLVAGLMGDSRQYDAWAQQIAGGQWIGTQVFYQTPLYPYSLAVVFLIAGHSLGAVRLVQAILGAASCALLGLAGRRFFSDRIGAIAALLLAIYPSALFFDGLIQKSSLDTFLITLILVLVAEFRARGDWKWLACLGVAVALFVLNRENARVLYPVLGLWLWFDFRNVPARRRIAWGAVVGAASLAVLLPVGYRNYRIGGDFLVSTSQLGPNFYIGNNPQASGSYEPLVEEHGDPVFERDDAVRLASKAAGRALSPAEVSDYWVREAFGYIRSHPFQWLALFGRKLLLTVNAAELPDTESIEAYADHSRILRAVLWLNFGVMLPLAVLGCWMYRTDWRRLLILHAMFAALCLAVALFYVVARYRYPLVPFVLLFAAAGASGLFDIVIARRNRTAAAGETRAARRKAESQRRRRPSQPQARLLPGVAFAGLAAVVANLPMHVVRDQTYLNLGSLLVQNGTPSDAIPFLRKAAALDPGYAEAHFKLGLASQLVGERQTAIEELATAIRLRPAHGEAHNALGVLLREEGRTDEALAHFEAAARYAPESEEAHTNLGLALLEAGRPAEAVVEHRRAIALAPRKATPHSNLAVALLQSGDSPQAIAECREALALQPDDAEAHTNLAIALASMRDFDGAFGEFRQAIRLRPDAYEIYAAYGNALGEAGKVAEGIEQYEAAARLAAAAGRSDAVAQIAEAIRQVKGDGRKQY